MRSILDPLPILAFTVVLCGCNGRSFLDLPPSEGVIEYALTFPDYDPDGLMAGMLPERTTLTFSDGKQVAELNAGMGIFKTAMIADNGAKLMDYHMSMMSKKLVSHMQPRDLEIFYADRQRPTILYTNDLDTIAGYPCRRAIAIFDKVDQPEIELWYTDRIKLKDPNWFSPFAEIPGVLLRYELYQHGIRMRLDAISVSPGPVDETKFQVKEEYQQVPPTVLHSELAQVLGTFKM